jgi:hypothetical protein
MIIVLIFYMGFLSIFQQLWGYGQLSHYLFYLHPSYLSSPNRLMLYNLSRMKQVEL